MKLRLPVMHLLLFCTDIQLHLLFLIVFLLFWKVRTALWCNYFQYRVVQKRHKDYGTI